MSLSKEDLMALQQIVARQLHELRQTRNAIEAEGRMKSSLELAIFRECDRLNSLETAITETLKGR